MQIIDTNIIYDAPDLKGLVSSGYLPIDMHVHTKYSDGVNSVQSVLKKAKSLGIGLAITDHNTINGAIFARQLIKKKKEFSDILLIPGIEVTVKDNFHILVYFSNFEDLTYFYINAVKPFLTVKSIRTKTDIDAMTMINVAREFDSLIFLAHPFVVTGVFVSAKSDESEVIQEADGYEVINAGIPEKSNEKAIEWLKAFKDKNYSAGSDSHANPLTGTAVTCVRKERVKTAGDFISEIKQKKHIVIGKSVNMKELAFNHLFFYRLFWNKLKKTRIMTKLSS